MRSAGCVAAVLAATMLANTSAQAATIELATWSMNNLHDLVGEPLRSGAPGRTEADYELLRKYRDRLDADVIELQEVQWSEGRGPRVPPGSVRPVFLGALYRGSRHRQGHQS